MQSGRGAMWGSSPVVLLPFAPGRRSVEVEQVQVQLEPGAGRAGGRRAGASSLHPLRVASYQANEIHAADALCLSSRGKLIQWSKSRARD